MLGEELTSTVSSVAVKVMVGPLSTCTNRCLQKPFRYAMAGRKAREKREKRTKRRDLLSYDGVKRLLAGKTRNKEVKSSSLGRHTKQKASKESTSH